MFVYKRLVNCMSKIRGSYQTIYNKFSQIINTVIILVAVIGIFSIIGKSNFYSFNNFQSMLFQIPEFGILAFAMMVPLLSGGINLSIVSTSILSGIMAALVMTKLILLGSGNLYIFIIIVLGILVAIITSIICGTINGFLIGAIGISPILVTLGTEKLFSGISMVITKGEPISGFPEKFLFLGVGTVSIIPVSMIIFLAVAFLLSLFLNKTGTGFNIYMLGSNPIAAMFSGINNKLLLIKVYIISGFLSGISAMIIISRVDSVKVGYGDSYVLKALLVTILGGVNPYGGFGSVFGVVLAILILQVISSGLTLIGISAFFRNVIWGGILFLVMAINFYRTKYQSRLKIK